MRRRLDLGERPYFLYPAITYPHKGHEHLVRAFARLAGDRPDPLLVLTGGKGPREPALRELIGSLGLEDRVRRVGRVPEADLDNLYRGAVALVLPSRYEGFGMTVLEAMSRRCPVIAADATALPEVVGGAGLLVDPDDLATMEHSHGRPARRPGAPGARLANAGEARARTFDWRRSARLLGRRVPRAGADHGTASRPPRGGRASMKITVLCPHFAPDLAPTGEVMTSIAGELARRGHELHVVTVAALVPRPCRHGRLGGSARPPRRHRLGAHHPGAPLPDRQGQHPRPGPRLRRLHRPGRLRGRHRPQPARHRVRHVPAPDPGAGRLVGGPRPAGSVRVQHPGRVPRRRRRAGPAHGPAGHRGGVVAGARLLPAGRRRHRPVRRAGRQRAGQGDPWPERPDRRAPGRTRCGSSPTSSTPSGSGRRTPRTPTAPSTA